MRTMGLEVSEEFSLVGLVVVASFLVNMTMASGVTKARKKYGVHYPTLYAVESENKDAKLFNCIQRGHQNFLEIVPFFLSLLMIAGLQHPRIASAAGVFFLFARFIYFKGYSSGDPKKRLHGAVMGYLGLFVLIGCCISFPVRQLLY